MKKIMLIIISVVMFFSACEKQTENITDTPAEISMDAPKTQIDPAEEFGGITFGMTKDEVIEFYERQPDRTFKDDDIIYENETYFNIGNADVDFRFDKNGKLHIIRIMYFYSDDSEINSLQADYDSIKEELLKRYSEAANYVNDYSNEYVTAFIISTDDRFISLLISDIPAISVDITGN